MRLIVLTWFSREYLIILDCQQVWWILWQKVLSISSCHRAILWLVYLFPRWSTILSQLSGTSWTWLLCWSHVLCQTSAGNHWRVDGFPAMVIQEFLYWATICQPLVGSQNLLLVAANLFIYTSSSTSANNRMNPETPGQAPFSFTISVLGAFMCITQHMGPTALRPIRRTKQLWLSVLLKDTNAATDQIGIRTHILTTPELESNAIDRSARHSHHLNHSYWYE